MEQKIQEIFDLITLNAAPLLTNKSVKWTTHIFYKGKAFKELDATNTWELCYTVASIYYILLFLRTDIKNDKDYVEICFNLERIGKNYNNYYLLFLNNLMDYIKENEDVLGEIGSKQDKQVLLDVIVGIWVRRNSSTSQESDQKTDEQIGVTIRVFANQIYSEIMQPFLN